MFHSIRWRIAISFGLLILLVLGGLTVYLTQFVRGAQLDSLRRELYTDACLVSEDAADLPGGVAGVASAEALAERWGGLLDARVTIIAEDGTVLGESAGEAAALENHLRRPEVWEALTTGRGSSIRHSTTVGEELLYVAVPYGPEGDPAGVVRVALSVAQIDADAAQVRRAIFLAALVASGLAVALAFYLAERTARPLRRLTQVAGRMAQGDLTARPIAWTQDEVGQLYQAFNHMAIQLQDKLTRLAEESGRLTAVLEHMADGVLITNSAGRVRMINPAACGILGVSTTDALGRTFAQIARHHHLIDIWRRTREVGTEQQEVVELHRQGLSVRVIATPLADEDMMGILVIFQDLTEVRRAERIRRDFVSNASHELRTPLASIKALVETLRDSALEDPPAARRFLDRVETEVDALTQMVQEFLELSRIESDRVPLVRKAVAVEEFLLPPVERLSPQAERAGLELEINLPANLPPVMADVERVRQVVTNLVHNAVKFTQPGGRVVVLAEVVGDEVVTSVRDTGVGIPADDLPRIFERFYKADRARTGGGTGLGLAIAKHVVQAHGGQIWAASVEGEGSTFSFSLPVAPAGAADVRKA